MSEQNKENFSEKVIQEIIKKIQMGEYTVGSKLPSEREMTKLFGVSRATIREALRVLQIMGIVENIPQVGTYVSSLQLQSFINAISPLIFLHENIDQDLFDFRMMIEKEAVKKACESSDFMHLKEIVKEMETDIIEESFKAERLDILFHKEIFHLSNNQILIKAMECVESLLAYSVNFNREKILKNPVNAKELIHQHKGILLALENKDTVQAEELMIKHLTMVQKEARKVK